MWVVPPCLSVFAFVDDSKKETKLVERKRHGLCPWSVTQKTNEWKFQINNTIPPPSTFDIDHKDRDGKTMPCALRYARWDLRGNHPTYVIR